jgi:catechol 2,3-dioxygenase-like lactoylglutathione lyase family enzyme
MQQVVPTLRITNYERSKSFYVHGLGFAIDWEHRFQPHFPVFLQATREGMSIFLTEHRGDCPAGGLVHFYVPAVDAWHAEFVGNGIAVAEPPNEDLPGLRMMTVVDPDGNKLRMCQRLEGWSRE